MAKTQSLRTWLVPKLRRVSYSWPSRTEAKRKARVDRGKYKCASCEKIFGPKEIKLDHKIPVIDPIDGFVGWDDYILRMFVDEDGFQVLCDMCHDIKTALEKEIRKTSKKKLDKDDDI